MILIIPILCFVKGGSLWRGLVQLYHKININWWKIIEMYIQQLINPEPLSNTIIFIIRHSRFSAQASANKSTAIYSSIGHNNRFFMSFITPICLFMQKIPNDRRRNLNFLFSIWALLFIDGSRAVIM